MAYQMWNQGNHWQNVDNLCVHKSHMWCGLFGTPSRKAAIVVVVHELETECIAENLRVSVESTF